jgi:hypothetical protein
VWIGEGKLTDDVEKRLRKLTAGWPIHRRDLIKINSGVVN